MLPHLPFCASDVDGIQSVQIRELRREKEREREHKGCVFVEREGGREREHKGCVCVEREGGREGGREHTVKPQPSTAL